MNRWLLLCAVFSAAFSCAAQQFHPVIPKAWDDKQVETFEVPLAQRDRSPRHLSSDQYYKFKVRPIYRSYPAYADGQEPSGYLESLKQKEPEIIFDPSKLHTRQDWIAAGKLVFESEIFFRPAAQMPSAGATPWPVSGDGVLPSFVPFFRYYIRKKGVLEVGSGACMTCHTRIMPDGSFLEGAQGMVRAPDTEANRALREARLRARVLRQAPLERQWINFGAPWVIGKEAYAAALAGEPPGRSADALTPFVFARQGTSRTHPPHVPSLIGLQDLKYLDATGLVHNRSIADVMRYAIANQGLDTLAFYGDFQPAPGATTFSGEEGTRYSDEQLYAMALYIESLKPPPNPNPVDSHARHGETVFRREGCIGCHTPPFYTNNKLTPAAGFHIPDDLKKELDILDVSVGTDPTLALATRRGTGFYKVPSLRGVWFRSGFGHGGWAETLEEWLDAARLKEDYVARGYHLGPGPVRGHEFGLKLSADDKRDLICFLKTL